MEEMFKTMCNVDIPDEMAFGNAPLDLDSMKIQMNLMGFSEYMSDVDFVIYLCGFINLYDNERVSGGWYGDKKSYISILNQSMKINQLLKRISKERQDLVNVMLETLDCRCYTSEKLRDLIMSNYLKHGIPQDTVEI